MRKEDQEHNSAEYEHHLAEALRRIKQTLPPENYGIRNALLPPNSISSLFDANLNQYRLHLDMGNPQRFSAYECASGSIVAQRILREHGIESNPVLLGETETYGIFSTDIALQLSDGRLVKTVPLFPMLDQESKAAEPAKILPPFTYNVENGILPVLFEVKGESRPFSYKKMPDSPIHHVSFVGLQGVNRKNKRLEMSYTSVSYDEESNQTITNYLYCSQWNVLRYWPVRRYEAVGDLSLKQEDGDYPLFEQDVRAMALFGAAILHAKHV